MKNYLANPSIMSFKEHLENEIHLNVESLLLDADEIRLANFDYRGLYKLMFLKEIELSIVNNIRKINSVTYSVPKFAKNFALILSLYVGFNIKEQNEYEKFSLDETYQLILNKLKNVKSKSIIDYRFIFSEIGLELKEDIIKEPN